MGSFFGAFSGGFNGGPKSVLFLGSVGHGIRLWFALASIIVGCLFLRPRGAIEMIDMIEVIEVSGGPADRGYVAQGLRWGNRVEDILDFGGFDSGGEYGIRL